MPATIPVRPAGARNLRRLASRRAVRSHQPMSNSMSAKPLHALRETLRVLTIALALALLGAAAVAAEGVKPHRIASHVDQNDPAVMNMALNNARHVIEHYREKHEDAEVEIVTYGPGLHMLRDDT